MWSMLKNIVSETDSAVKSMTGATTAKFMDRGVYSIHLLIGLCQMLLDRTGSTMCSSYLISFVHSHTLWACCWQLDLCSHPSENPSFFSLFEKAWCRSSALSSTTAGHPSGLTAALSLSVFRGCCKPDGVTKSVPTQTDKVRWCVWECVSGWMSPPTPAPHKENCCSSRQEERTDWDLMFSVKLCTWAGWTLSRSTLSRG